MMLPFVTAWAPRFPTSLADGCVVEGEVENSVLPGSNGRQEGEGKNSIVMQGTVIGENSHLSG